MHTSNFLDMYTKDTIPLSPTFPDQHASFFPSGMAGLELKTHPQVENKVC